jgi:hypothetical protein
MVFLLVVTGCTDPGGYQGSGVVTYNGVTYQGMTTVTDSTSPRNTDSFDYITVTEPAVKGFDADGFFELHGGTELTGDRQYVYIRLVKDSSDNSSDYWGRGTDFTKRIWLRYGSGSYTLYVYNTIINSCGLEYDGDISSFGITESNPVYIFSVNNTRSENGIDLYPSDVVQSDSKSISNLVNQVISDPTSDEDRIRQIHNYLVLNYYYDDDSIVASTRKKQDSLSVLANECCVCEGYTCLFLAIARASGIRSRAHISIPGSSSGAHAWAAVYMDDSWYYVDPTLDDTGGTTAGSTSIKHEWFMFNGSTFHENNGAGNYIKTGW